jgi:hypothetical protein
MRNPVRIHGTNTVQYNPQTVRSVRIAPGSIATRSFGDLRLSADDGVTGIVFVYHHGVEQFGVER